MRSTKRIAIVIGAGTVGSASAYHLARADWAVYVLDAGGVAAGASGAAEGIVGSVAKRKAGPVTDIVVRSFAAFPSLSGELDHDIEFMRKPGLMVVHDEGDAGLFHAFVAKRAEEGLSIEWLDAASSRAVEPMLGDELVGSVFTPEQGTVNPIQLAHGYLKAAKRNGATVVSGATVTGFDVAKGRITAVRTPGAPYPADLVINAAGASAQAIAAMAGDHVVITPKRAQMIMSEALEPGSLRNTLYSGAVVAAGMNRESLDFEDVPGHSAGVDAEAANKWQLSSLTQTARGNVLFCGGFGFSGTDRRAEPEVVQAIAGNIAELIPRYGCDHLRIIRAWAELEPCTPDNMPVVRYARETENLIHAAGFGNAGVMMSPCAGQLVAQLAAGNATDPVLTALHGARSTAVGPPSRQPLERH